METNGVRQGMGIIHSGVTDAVFRSGVAWDLSAEASTEWTKYWPMLSVWD